MANMARNDAPGSYQIGIYTVTKIGREWEAWSTGALGEYRKRFSSLAAAHLQLTGESMRATRADRRQRAKSRAWARK